VRKIELCPDREWDYVMSLDMIGVTRGVSVSPLMCAAWDWLSWLVWVLVAGVTREGFNDFASTFVGRLGFVSHRYKV
jgi:hypothetical protein